MIVWINHIQIQEGLITDLFYIHIYKILCWF